MGLKGTLKKLARRLPGVGPDWPPCPRCGGYCDLVPDRRSGTTSSRKECVPVERIYGHECAERGARLRVYASRRSEYQKRAGS